MLEESEKHKVEYEVHRLVVNRDPKFTNFVEFRTHKVIYRRYAGLFFSLCVDITDNELAYLECIHLFVEILDHFFSNVCELDLVFNFHKVYLILDEFILAGELQETSKKIEMQQQQILSLANNLKLQNEQRVIQVNLFKERISQMTTDFRLLQMERNVDAAKSDMLMGMEHKEALQYKLKLDQLEGELADFKEGFGILSHKCSELKDIPNSVNHNGEESEVQKLKHENEKLVLKNSALSSERDFVWNQFKKVENNLTDQIKTKNTKIEQADEKIRKLLGDMEKLQSSNNEKDEKITALRTKMAILEDESVKKSEEISRLTKETELLRKSKGDYNTPVLRRCSVEQKMTRFGGKSSGSVTVKKEIHSSQALEKGSRNSKRKACENNNSPSTSSEVPKLFTSTFKVPKLKTNSSSRCVI